MRRTLRSTTALALVLLLTPAALPAAGRPVAPRPGLPKGVRPLALELSRRMDELVREAEKYRGLKLKHPVPYGALDEKGLSAKVAETLAEELPAKELRALDLSLQAFGLLPEGASAGKIYRDLLGQQVAAFYDPERKYLAMVERRGANGAGALGKAVGDDLARRAEEGILVHELTHAVDDQNFDIREATKGDPLEDGSAAYLSLVEGDATVTMFDFVLGRRIEGIPGFDKNFGGLLSSSGLASLSPDLPGAAGIADAPPWFRESLFFSYFQGFAFCLDVARRGGQKLLDYAFAKDPPRSTEQILHPEKWYGRRDDPVGLAWPDLSRALPGWQKAAEGQLGEEGIGILLRQAFPAEEARATAAATGWGGDRFAVYEQGGGKAGRRLLLWVTEWDSEAEANDFQAAALHLGEGWKVVRSAPTRVALSRGELPEEARTATAAALAAIPAERPANRGIDLAALGIGPESPAPPAPAPPRP
jgi:hypothetical protein